MSLKEALERRKELAKSRALQSYQEAKARRQNKIKSKTYVITVFISNHFICFIHALCKKNHL
jgi:hypothetical protein